MMKIVRMKTWSSYVDSRRLLQKEGFINIDKRLEAYIRAIIEEVRKKGDAALIRFTEQFDGVSLNPENLRVSSEEINDAYSKVTEDQISAIKTVKEKLEFVEKHLLEQARMEMKLGRVTIKFCTRPIKRVGCYVPSGNAAYPSTLVMTVVPAIVAGVPRVTVCSSPSRDGTLNPLTLVAADVCGVSEIYRVGGAQAIAAMAYGTETVKPVDKIVGPGNTYVSMAKVLVSRDVAIDFPAGPSELLVMADETANPRFIALDMCAQAEHGPDSIVGLVTTSERLAEKAISELDDIARSSPRSDIVFKALSNNGFVVICKTVDEMVEFTNTFAPEHVEVMLKNPENVIERISTAGLILSGSYSPASLSDYCGWTNHVLPTWGYGKIFSALSSLDFVRRVAVVECSKMGLMEAFENIRILSEAEKLPGHFKAVEGRFKNGEKCR
jgi:histidinol dehydrogenase